MYAEQPHWGGVCPERPYMSMTDAKMQPDPDWSRIIFFSNVGDGGSLLG